MPTLDQRCAAWEAHRAQLIALAQNAARAQLADARPQDVGVLTAALNTADTPRCAGSLSLLATTAYRDEKFGRATCNRWLELAKEYVRANPKDNLSVEALAAQYACCTASSVVWHVQKVQRLADPRCEPDRAVGLLEDLKLLEQLDRYTRVNTTPPPEMP